jgi:DNA-binding NarL/FixJ family response regulator
MSHDANAVPRVLLVDDDILVLASLVRLLDQRCDVQIVVAKSTSDALNRLNATAFDLLVADWRLPGLGGHDLLTIAAARWPAMRRVILAGEIVDEPLADECFVKGDDPVYITERLCLLAHTERD